MKIAILGYGTEGKSAEAYFQKHHAETQVFDNFQTDDIPKFDLDNFDLVLRSPSVPPIGNWSSITKYFFAHCPCPIIGVTGTKGKGTTCSMIVAILKALGKKVWLVGNIGKPALDVLDDVKADDVVVYEMSSFQLWDLEQSPHVAVVLRIEPDHLNIHKDFADYVDAKANIVKYQSANDYCVYNVDNQYSQEIAKQSLAQKISYPNNSPNTKEITKTLNAPGEHNRENAEAAIAASASILGESLEDFVEKYGSVVKQALASFQGLPHRLQFLRTLNEVEYYDDNFCTNTASLEVALKAFPQAKIVLIAGGRNKTANTDLPTIIKLMKTYSIKNILIGESGHDIAKQANDLAYTTVESLEEAVHTAKRSAEEIKKQNPETKVIVLMSPAAASFDMFKNVYDRGEQYQDLVKSL